MIVHRRRLFFSSIKIHFKAPTRKRQRSWGQREREIEPSIVCVMIVRSGVYLIYFYLHLHSQVQAPPCPKKKKTDKYLYLSDGNGTKYESENREPRIETGLLTSFIGLTMGPCLLEECEKVRELLFKCLFIAAL